MTDNLAALKLCPFCGHAPVHQQKPNDGRWIADCHTVTCIRPTTGFRHTEAESIAAWNTRAEQSCAEKDAEIAAWLRGVAEPLPVNGDKRHILLAVADEIERGEYARV